jgi:phage FluMu protein Com
MADEKQTVEVICPKCRETKIITLPKDELPKCPQCRVRMMINEILTEGKSY